MGDAIGLGELPESVGAQHPGRGETQPVHDLDKSGRAALRVPVGQPGDIPAAAEFQRGQPGVLLGV